MEKNLADILVDELYELTNKKVPEAVLFQIKKCILDYLGACLAGGVMVKDKGEVYLDFFDAEQSEATVIGFNRKASIHNSVFINGYSGHIAELDDGHRFSTVHLGATVIPAVLAIVEHEKLSGKDLLRGVLIGYEAAIRLGMAIQPSHKNLGFHASGTCGTIGAAMGIGAALRASKAQMKNILSASVASAAGILEVIEDESELKPYNIGRASHDGLTAAYVGISGFKGPKDVLGGKRGLFALMSERNDPTKLLQESDNSYGIEKIYRKPYAACRHCHAPIEAILNFKKDYNIPNSNIQEINVKTYLQAVIGHDHTDVSGVTSAKMSTPYCVGVALETGKAGLNEFLPEIINNKSINILAKKVNTLEDVELSALVPDKRGAIVEIITKDGENYIERIDYPKGEPENLMSKEEIEEKFITLAKYSGKTDAESKKIIQHVWNIEKELAQLFAIL